MKSTILITGANRGLGLEFVKQYAKADWLVLATCREPKHAVSLNRLSQTNNNIEIFSLDVTSEKDITSLAKILENKPIDILLNNAGVFGKSTSVGKFNKQLWSEVIDVNLIGAFLITQALLPNILLGQKKIIASISSGYGSITETTEYGHYPYAASKAALNMMMKMLALELADKKIISVALSPGWVKTDMGGENASLTPEESITGLKNLLASLNLNDSGKFFSYQGHELPW